VVAIIGIKMAVVTIGTRTAEAVVVLKG
jgi:hypothetical protein